MLQALGPVLCVLQVPYAAVLKPVALTEALNDLGCLHRACPICTHRLKQLGNQLIVCNGIAFITQLLQLLYGFKL